MGKVGYHFQDAQEAIDRVIRHSNPSADSFGSTNGAKDIHGINQNGDTLRPAINRGCFQVPPTGDIPTDDFIESFSGLMDNMASATTNYKDFPEQLFTTTTTQ